MGKFCLWNPESWVLESGISQTIELTNGCLFNFEGSRERGGADGKQLKDVEAFILTSVTSLTKLIYHLLSKTSRVFKNGGISSPYF